MRALRWTPKGDVRRHMEFYVSFMYIYMEKTFSQGYTRVRGLNSDLHAQIQEFEDSCVVLNFLDVEPGHIPSDN